jgi:hypothetical protein
VKLGKSVTKTLEILREAFGEYSLSRTVVSECSSRFTACRVSVDDDKTFWVTKRQQNDTKCC